MLAIRPTTAQICTPNLLPARIHHTGPINDTHRYWTPTTDEKGTRHVHFRGRHLHGTTLPLPAGYTGAIVRTTEQTLPVSRRQPVDESRADEEQDGDVEEEEEEQGDVKIAEQIASFDEVVLWEHGGMVDCERDAFARGLGEWVGWAGCMHGEEEEEEEEKDGEVEKKA